MTAAQKKNVERFKKAAAEAKKLRKKNPKLTQAQAVKQAFAILYKTGKVAAVKKTATKKPARKKATSKSYHKDTKSHNVRINVVSGNLKHNMLTLDFYLDLKKEIAQRESVIQSVIERKKELEIKNGKAWYPKWIKNAKKIVTAQKKLLTQIKRYI